MHLYGIVWLADYEDDRRLESALSSLYGKVRVWQSAVFILYFIILNGTVEERQARKKTAAAEETTTTKRKSSEWKERKHDDG